MGKIRREPTDVGSASKEWNIVYNVFTIGGQAPRNKNRVFADIIIDSSSLYQKLKKHDLVPALDNYSRVDR